MGARWSAFGSRSIGRCLVPALVLAALLVLPVGASQAEDGPTAGAVPVENKGAPPSPVRSTEEADASQKYSADELKEIVGPIALYPDVLVSSILPASTVPMDVVKAARWVKEQKGDVEELPTDADWDESVQALVQFPDTLQWMSENLDWLEQLGWAVSVQEDDVLGAIQEYRREAKKAGNLESNDKQKVVAEGEGAIEVQPADPEVVYVPVYDPVQVIQPVYTPVYGSGYVSPWVSWGVGVAMGALGAWAWHGIRWGGWHGGHWGGGGIYVNNRPTYNFNRGGSINRPANRPGGGGRWRPPGNRPGSPGNRPGGRPGQRPQRPGGGVSRPSRPGGGMPGGTRPGGTRPGGARPGGVKPPSARPGGGAGGRPAAGDRPATRPGGGVSRPTRPAPGAGSRPSTGNRAGAGPGSGTRAGSRPGASHRSSGASSRARSSYGGSRSRSAYGGSHRGGSAARSHASRGRSSYGGGSRGGGGRARGGGGRGGGGRRR